MNAPFAHAHVSHVSKAQRRRSRSLTVLNSSRADSPGQNHQQKQFLAQLQKHRQRQQSDHEEQEEENLNQSVSTKKKRTNNALSSKRHAPSAMTISTTVRKNIRPTTGKTSVIQQNELYQAAVTRMPQSTAVLLMKPGAGDNEIPLTRVKSDYIQEDEHQPQVTRIHRSESMKSFDKQISTETNTSSLIHSFTTIKNSNANSTTEGKDLCLNSSEISSYPLIPSSTNKMTNSELFDQEFSLTDNKNDPRTTDVRNRGIMKRNERENQYIAETPELSNKSSTSLMVAIIAIVIAILAFILALTAFILVLSLRYTVYNSLGTNSTTSGSSSSGSSSSSGTSGGTLPSSCSAYITLTDPTRNVYAAGYALGCDNSAPFTNRTSPVWIRFTGSGGTTLPLTTIGTNQCGSVITGWYSGTMPSSTGQIINGTACFTFSYSVCQYSVSISVANCDSFYIYLLPPPPVCMARYCTI